MTPQAANTLTALSALAVAIVLWVALFAGWGI